MTSQAEINKLQVQINNGALKIALQKKDTERSALFMAMRKDGTVNAVEAMREYAASMRQFAMLLEHQAHLVQRLEELRMEDQKSG